MAKAKKPRSEAQIKATEKLVAFNKKRRAAAAKTAAKPATKKARTYTVSNATSKPVRYKRNPIDTKRAQGMLTENIKPAAIGAVGALGIDLVWGKLPVPTSLRAGVVKYPVKAALAIGLGMIAEKVLPKAQQKYAVDVVRGSLTVIMHEAGKGLLQSRYPSLALAAYEEDELAEIMADEQMNGFYESPEYEGMGEVLQLEGLAPNATPDFYVPQYEGVSY